MKALFWFAVLLVAALAVAGAENKDLVYLAVLLAVFIMGAGIAYRRT